MVLVISYTFWFITVEIITDTARKFTVSLILYGSPTFVAIVF